MRLYLFVVVVVVLLSVKRCMWTGRMGERGEGTVRKMGGGEGGGRGATKIERGREWVTEN